MWIPLRMADARCGTKAAGLRLLMEAGFMVPDGIVVPDPQSTDWEPVLAAALHDIGPGPYAVRSSAVVEDRPDASYAGQLHTSLNLTTPTQVAAAVRRTAISPQADAARIAKRVDLTEPEVNEHLLDAQANGWVTWSSYTGDSGWSLTETGKQKGEQLLAAELDAAHARGMVEDVHTDFLPLNAKVSGACTTWQLTEMGIATQPVDLTVIIATLTQAAHELAELEERLTQHLARFAGYHHRFSKAVTHACSAPRWITATDRDSCHRVWFELHEDLIATLGLAR